MELSRDAPAAEAVGCASPRVRRPRRAVLHARWRQRRFELPSQDTETDATPGSPSLSTVARNHLARPRVTAVRASHDTTVCPRAEARSSPACSLLRGLPGGGRWMRRPAPPHDPRPPTEVGGHAPLASCPLSPHDPLRCPEGLRKTVGPQKRLVRAPPARCRGGASQEAPPRARARGRLRAATTSVTSRLEAGRGLASKPLATATATAACVGLRPRAPAPARGLRGSRACPSTFPRVGGRRRHATRCRAPSSRAHRLGKARAHSTSFDSSFRPPRRSAVAGARCRAPEG